MHCNNQILIHQESHSKWVPESSISVWIHSRSFTLSSGLYRRSNVIYIVNVSRGGDFRHVCESFCCCVFYLFEKETKETPSSRQETLMERSLLQSKPDRFSLIKHPNRKITEFGPDEPHQTWLPVSQNLLTLNDLLFSMIYPFYFPPDENQTSHMSNERPFP